MKYNPKKSIMYHKNSHITSYSHMQRAHNQNVPGLFGLSMSLNIRFGSIYGVDVCTEVATTTDSIKEIVIKILENDLVRRQLHIVKM